ncbi:hypothetical protein TGP89_295370 [Toxoplasma gondii p89]|uniref:Uncharacterized protein n=2 Tax=Toxoplasma gondii TaxID=5811 RepID=A0A2T6IG53_TOXGO|nr:hypothetical protein TGP89_295370 [Toxoplasma gondii p89]PUA84323.1 hypothetical protein TGBR9_295370 [Toxoplasma gondii TgCATBr9]
MRVLGSPQLPSFRLSDRAGAVIARTLSFSSLHRQVTPPTFFSPLVSVRIFGANASGDCSAETHRGPWRLFSSFQQRQRMRSMSSRASAHESATGAPVSGDVSAEKKEGTEARDCRWPEQKGGGDGEAEDSMALNEKRSLLSRVLTLEQRVGALERALRENERQLKEFVIEKVLDLEDELRTLDPRHHTVSAVGSSSRPGEAASEATNCMQPSHVVVESFEGVGETLQGATVESAGSVKSESGEGDNPFIIDTPCSVSTVCTDTPRRQRGRSRE